ncbi:p21-C-terminal region-binding protein-domain-containing protein [Peziza echinospora]|nr:p21-C-terminal region-binding protein-domain-containing protein [Peziza echinospora]
MATKRKHGRQPIPSGAPPAEDVEMKSDGDEDSDEDFTEIDVSFEMFDPQPAVDFHGLKTLLRQLLDIDNTLFDLSGLANLILAQPLLGTTVKVDTNEGDPYAFLTVLNLTRREQEKEWARVARSLREYILQKAKSANDDGKMYNLLHPLLPVQENLVGAEQKCVGVILTERLLNVPTEVTPPMYKMMLEEVQWAIEDNEPYNFSHYLILSKTYTEIESALDAEGSDDDDDHHTTATKPSQQQPQSKKFKSQLKQKAAPPPPPQKQKTKAAKNSNKKKEIFYFHPEDELIQKNATAWISYRYTKEDDLVAADARRTFSDMGIAPQGHMVLVTKEQLEETIGRLENAFKP